MTQLYIGRLHQPERKGNFSVRTLMSPPNQGFVHFCNCCIRKHTFLSYSL